MFNATKLNKQLKKEQDFYKQSRKGFSWIYLTTIIAVMLSNDNIYQFNFGIFALYYLFYISSMMYFENERILTCGNKFASFPILYILAIKSKKLKDDVLEISDEIADKWNILATDDRIRYTRIYKIKSYIESMITFGIMWAVTHYTMKLIGV